MHEINIKQNMEYVDEALVEMSHGLNVAKNCGHRVLKIIHGYGSHGQGGAIKRAVHRELCDLRACMQVADFVRGEDFGTFNETTQRIYGADVTVARDSDYNRRNPGVTIVLVY